MVRTHQKLSSVVGEIEYVWQLIHYSEWELLRLKNFGRKSLNEIKVTLHSCGFNLKTSLRSEDIKKIRAFQYVPDNDCLREWLRTTAVKLSRFPLDLLSKREEQILRKRIWATGEKMTFQQLGQFWGVSKTLPSVIEKTVLSKLRRRFIKELVDVNYLLLGEFAARCNCIEFTDTCFDLFNLSEQEKNITESLLGLAVDGLVVNWDQSRLLLNEYSDKSLSSTNTAKRSKSGKLNKYDRVRTYTFFHSRKVSVHKSQHLYTLPTAGSDNSDNYFLQKQEKIDENSLKWTRNYTPRLALC